MEALIGRTLGNYQIVEEIGQGGMAIVYKAVQPALQRYVAIKVLPPQFTFDTIFVQRFQREAVAAGRLKHPNIVTIYDVGEQDGIYYIVMEYLEGVILAELIRQQGPLPLQKVAHIVGQVASALDYAHGQGFIHRDIKPGNVIVGPGDHATLTDFGIVKAVEGTTITRTGMMIGTPQYMSPEQIQGHEIDYRADIYSLGIVCYEMLTGRVPFGGETPAILHAHVYEPLPPIRSLRSDLPAEVETAINKALAKEPGGRYASTIQFAQALAPKRATEPATLIAPTVNQRAQIESLIRQLESKERQKWEKAAKALVEIGMPAADQLSESALDREWWTMIPSKLAEAGGVRAAQLLIAMAGRMKVEEDFWYDYTFDTLYDLSPISTVAFGLRLIGDPAMEMLIDALWNSSESIRLVAVLTLGLLENPRTVEPLSKALRDTNLWVRRTAAWGFGELGDARAAEPLIQSIDDTDEIVRQNVARALGEIGDARAVEPLIGLLRGDPNAGVHWEAKAALGKISDARAMEPLIGLLRDPDAGVRGGAAWALGEIGDARAVEPLISLLRDPDTWVRKDATEALGKVGDPQALPYLRWVVENDADSIVRFAAQKAIELIQ